MFNQKSIPNRPSPPLVRGAIARGLLLATVLAVMTVAGLEPGTRSPPLPPSIAEQTNSEQRF